MKKIFEPKKIQKKWYSYWEENKLFSPKVSSNKKPFSIMIPPPNVTGSLHMGHGFQNTLMDTLSRYKRLKGFEVLWQPGTDHAGIATQLVVERNLEQKGGLEVEIKFREYHFFSIKKNGSFVRLEQREIYNGQGFQ